MENQHINLAILANILFGLVVITAVKKPIISRGFLAISFLLASVFNCYKLLNLDALSKNEEMSLLPLFKSYTIGFSANLVFTVVMIITITQFLIFVGLTLNKRWTNVTSIIGILYGIALSSLGGFEFPAALLMSIAFLILAGNYKHDFIWKFDQYEIELNESHGSQKNTVA